MEYGVTKTSASIPFRLGTFSTNDGPRFAGIVADARVLPLGTAFEYLRAPDSAIAAADSLLGIVEEWDRSFPLVQQAAGLLSAGGELQEQATPLDALSVHPPIDLPRQIFCSGANYKQHVIDLIMAQVPEETRNMSVEERRAFAQQKMDNRAANGTPFCFIKAQSSVAGPFDPIVLPHDVSQADWELELAVIMGRKARRVGREQALGYVAGYTIANDVTSRERLLRRADDLRNLGHDWTAGKCSPSYLPLGPYLTPAAFIDDPNKLQITLKLNGEVMQDESTADMIFDVARLIEYLSAIVVLQPGDVICTGSPAGNGMHYGRFLRPGDIVEGTIAGLGTQRNVCVAEEI